MKLFFFFLIGLCAASWPKAWNMEKKFKKLLIDQLPCGENEATRPAACCVCYAIVHRIEDQLNGTMDDHPVDTVFRLSEEKITIPFSHSEDRILEVLDTVCSEVTFSIPNESRIEQVDALMKESCINFVGAYEDELIHIFYIIVSPGKDRMCGDTIQVCKPTHEEL